MKTIKRKSEHQSEVLKIFLRKVNFIKKKRKVKTNKGIKITKKKKNLKLQAILPFGIIFLDMNIILSPKMILGDKF